MKSRTPTAKEKPPPVGDGLIQVNARLSADDQIVNSRALGMDAMSEGHEATLLAYLMKNPEAINGDIDDTLFFADKHKLIFGAIVALSGNGQLPGDLQVSDWLERNNQIDKAGGHSEVSALGNMSIHLNPSSFEYAIGELRERRAARQSAEIAQRMLSGTITPAEAATTLADIVGDQGAGEMEARPLADLLAPCHPDPSELLRSRFLCRGGGLLIVGPTGIGKSAFALQCAINWALGRPIFDIWPARPLKSLVIQAENDEGDMAEMRDGVAAGLSLGLEELAQTAAKIDLVCEDSRTGTDFLSRTVEPGLRKYCPDLLWIDPALAYLGGENNSQKDVGGFLQNGLNPIVHRYGCGAVIVHHPPKPSSNKEKSELGGSDLAYLGAGSAEWANWARAVLVFKSRGAHDVYELLLAKRGARVGWRSAEGEREFKKYVAHTKDPGLICWIEVSEDEAEARKGRGAPKRFTTDDVLSVLRSGMTTAEWKSECYNEIGMQRATFFNLKRELEDRRLVSKSKEGRWSQSDHESTKSNKSKIHLLDTKSKKSNPL